MEINKNDSDDNSTTGRYAEELEIEGHNLDPDLDATWTTLFGAPPGNAVDEKIVMQADTEVTWAAGSVEVAGVMSLKVKETRIAGVKKITIKGVDPETGSSESESC